MTEALAKKEPQTLAGEMERVLIMGDLSGLKPEERLSYYKAVCTSVGLNPLTKPFDFINLNGKLVLYAKRECTEQLRKINAVSIVALDNEMVQDVYIVKAKAQDKTGRTDCSTGAVTLGKLTGDALANALMKAETKAKRRVTLSICGLGLLDESELETANDEAPKAPEPNMVVRCAHCGSEAGHEPDCPTKAGPKPNAAAKPRASKSEAKQEVAKSKQAEGKVLQPEAKPESKNKVGWLYVDKIEEKSTKATPAKGDKPATPGRPYLVLACNDRQGGKFTVYVWHKTLMEHKDALWGNWAEMEISAKTSASDPSKTLLSLEKVTQTEDENGITKWIDNRPMTDEEQMQELQEGGMTAEDAGFDTP